MEFVTETGILLVERGQVRLRFPISGAGGGDGGGSQQTTSQSTADPALNTMNQLAGQQIGAGVAQTGGYPAFLKFNPLAIPGAAEQALVGQIGATAAGQGGITGLEQEGLAGLERLGSPEESLGRAQGLFEKFAAPIIRNDATIRGQGRGGAVPEALAQGFGQMTLPILERATGAREQLAKQQMGLGPALNMRALQSLETQLRAAGSQRQALSAEYMRPLQSIASLIGGLPLGGGATTGYQTGQLQTQRPETDWLTDVLVPLGAAAAAGYAGS